MDKVQSEAIHSLGYDKATGAISVAFHSGGTHKFGPFSEHDYEAFKNASSIGKHFHAHIRAKKLG